MSLVLVTGGAGFIGSHVAEALVSSGASVRILDSMDTFYARALKQANMRRVAGAARGGADVEVQEGDIRDARAVERAVRGCSSVIHLAALAGVRPSLVDPARYCDVNVTGTQRLLCALEGRPEVKVLFGSSSSVYGASRRVPFSEEEAADDPVSPYAATKRAGELLARTFHNLHGNPVACLRFFTVYGPAQRPEMAIHKFTRLVASGQPVPFHGDGHSARDYTWVGDIVAGVLACLERLRGFRVYNLGGAHAVTLRELVERIGAALGREPVLERLPEQPGDVPVTCADIARARDELGYDVTVPPEEGIPRFVDWYLRERAEGRLA